MISRCQGGLFPRCLTYVPAALGLTLGWHGSCSRLGWEARLCCGAVSFCACRREVKKSCFSDLPRNVPSAQRNIHTSYRLFSSMDANTKKARREHEEPRLQRIRQKRSRLHCYSVHIFACKLSYLKRYQLEDWQSLISLPLALFVPAGVTNHRKHGELRSIMLHPLTKIRIEQRGHALVDLRAETTRFAPKQRHAGMGRD